MTSQEGTGVSGSSEHKFLSLDSSVRLLKEYDGSTKGDKVHDFIDLCEMALNSSDPRSKDILFKIIKTKLTGRARSLTKYRDFQTWDELKDYLEEVFSEKRSVNFWQLELNSCKQGRNEDITSYSNRIEKLLSNLIDASTIGKTQPIAAEISLLLRSQALSVFVQGLNDPLKLQIKARNPQNLEDAIELAREEERQILSSKSRYNNNYYSTASASSKKPNSQITCFNCKKIGHYEKDCYFKHKFSQSQTQARPERSFNVNAKGITCQYCKKLGHKITDCRKRIYNEAQRNKQSGNVQSPSASGQPSAARH